MSKKWIFIVDTEQYAGNFEREMGLYMTGGHLEYPGIGDFKRMYQEDTGEMDESRFESILGVHEYDGEHEPSWVSNWPTPGWFNHGMGGHFRDGQEKEATDHYRKACLEFAKTRGVHPNDRVKHEARWREYAEEPLKKHPAYLSVAIVFTRRPSDADIQFLKDRAAVFPDKYAEEVGNMFGHDRITIAGFRLLKEETEYEEEPV